jgi:hypothetical protein
MNAVAKEKPLARILNCTLDEYYADPCEVPSLSQSIAKTIVTKSALHAWTEHPRFGANRGDSTAAMDEGTLIHRLVLGKGADVVIVESDAFRTNAAKAARDEAIAAGKLPVLAHKYENALAVANTLKSNLLTEHGIRLDGESEVAIEWQEEGADGLVTCRGLMDHVKIDEGRIYDVKKVESAHPRNCGKKVIEYGYDIQHAAYTRALAKLRPELEGRIDFVFLYMEIEPPYAITPGRLSGIVRECGSQRWDRAVLAWEKCLNSNRWPAYADRIVQIEAPQWAINQEMENEHASNW